MSSFKVIIVGGGLSGALLGNGLVKHGVDVQVYERKERNSTEEGYQIRLGENCLKGMRACLEKDRLSSVLKIFGRAAAQPSDAPIIYDTEFRKLLDLNSLPAYSKSAPINRRALQDALSHPLFEAGRLQYEKNFARYSIVGESDDERVRVVFDDGTSDDCDILIGADGNQSRINRQLNCNNIEKIESHAIFLTKCDLPVATYQTLSPELVGSPIGTFSGNISFFFSVYLPDEVEPTEERGSATTQEASTDQTASCMLGVVIPSNLLPKDLNSLSTDEKWDITSKAMENWSSKHHEVIKLLEGQSIYSFWPRVGSDPSTSWRKTASTAEDPSKGHARVWLMGDAIHPMLPNRGMGANQAMHDTADALPLLVELAKKHKDHGIKKADVLDACSRFEQSMIPRAFGWVRKSGSNKPMIVDLEKTIDYVGVTLFSYLLPVVRVGYSLLGMLYGQNNAEDAPEFSQSHGAK